jgi:hypothetical protein
MISYFLRAFVIASFAWYGYTLDKIDLVLAWSILNTLIIWEGIIKGDDGGK